MEQYLPAAAAFAFSLLLYHLQCYQLPLLLLLPSDQARVARQAPVKVPASPWASCTVALAAH
jgi:hypothetical protein